MHRASHKSTLTPTQVYYVTRGRIVSAKKKFSNVKNDYEIGLVHDTEVDEVCVHQHVPHMR